MQSLCRDYRFEFLPMIVGALGYKPKCLFKYAEDLRCEKKETKKHISRMQGIVTNGTVNLQNIFELLDPQKSPDYSSFRFILIC